MESQDPLQDTKNMTFGRALCYLKSGELISREGWNGKGLFIFQQIPATIALDIIPKMQSVPDKAKKIFAERGKEISYGNQMALVTPDNKISGWAPSSSDTLAEDWFIL